MAEIGYNVHSDELILHIDEVLDGLIDIKPALIGMAGIISHAIDETMHGYPYPDILPKSRAQRKFDHTTPPNIDSTHLMQAIMSYRDKVEGSALEYGDNGFTIGLDPDARVDFYRDLLGFSGQDSKGRTIDQPARDPLTSALSDSADEMVSLLDVYMTGLIMSGN